MSRAARIMSGLILILVPTIQYGGYFLLKQLSNQASGYMAHPLRQDLQRAGHAHAGVIILLSLIGQLMADHAALPRGLAWLVRLGLPLSAMLLSAGFFLGAPSADAAEPGRLIVLVYAGAILLAVSVLTLAVGLLRPAPVKQPA